MNSFQSRILLRADVRFFSSLSPMSSISHMKPDPLCSHASILSFHSLHEYLCDSPFFSGPLLCFCLYPASPHLLPSSVLLSCFCAIFIRSLPLTPTDRSAWSANPWPASSSRPSGSSQHQAPTREIMPNNSNNHPHQHHQHRHRHHPHVLPLRHRRPTLRNLVSCTSPPRTTW